MKRFFQCIKNIFTDNTQATSSPMVKEEPPVPQPTASHYVPFPDEPSIFCTDPNEVSPLWVAWARRKHYLPLPQAEATGVKIKKFLEQSPFRKVNPRVVPDLLVRTGLQGDYSLSLSLEWVLWRSNVAKITLHEAHQEGVLLAVRVHADGRWGCPLR